MLKWGTYHLYTGSISEEPLWRWLSWNRCHQAVRFFPVCSMTTVSIIAVVCVPILLLLLLLTQFNMFLQEHFLPLVPVSLSLRNTHPDVILSDPGGPLLVSMAELALLPPPVLPHPTCSPPPLPRLLWIKASNRFKSHPRFCPVTPIAPAPLVSLAILLPLHAPLLWWCFSGLR